MEQRTEDLRASQARVIQQEKMAAFGLLAAGIAHEVGNPLAAVSSLVQILKRRRPDPYTDEKLDLAARQLQRIERHDPRAGRLFSTGLHGGEPTCESARWLMKRSGSPSIISAPNSARSRRTSPPTLPAVTGVRDYLTQVVLNLVLNAIDATDDQGRIHVAVQSEPGWLVLTIEDDGRGISLADRCRLFQPFFTTKPHGTGLGLFVSRQILEDDSGTLSVRSEPGQGSTFLFVCRSSTLNWNKRPGIRPTMLTCKRPNR